MKLAEFCEKHNILYRQLGSTALRLDAEDKIPAGLSDVDDYEVVSRSETTATLRPKPGKSEDE